MTTLEEVTFTRRRATLPIQTYTLGKAGQRKMNTLGETLILEGIDFLDTLKQLTTDPAVHLLADLIQVKSAVTNIAVMPVGLNQVEKNKLSKGYKHLNTLGLVHRIKRGTYIINPRLSPPYPEFMEKVYLHWFQLTGEQP